MTTPELAALISVLVGGIGLGFSWWLWPPASPPRAASRRNVAVKLKRRAVMEGPPTSPATSWDVPPPYDWERRPAARADLDLRHVPLIGRHTARRDLGWLAWPASRSS